MRAWPIAVVLFLTACGSGSSGTPVATPARTHTLAPSPTPTLPAPTVLSGDITFRTADGNVGCELQPAYARCDVRAHSWASPPKPKDCHNTWGDSVEFTVGTKASFFCWFGSSNLGAKRVLPVGQALQVGLVTCRASARAVECSGQGHGFRVGRAEDLRY